MSYPAAISRLRTTMLVAVVLLVAGLLAYKDSFRVPFLFDDFGSIRDNPSIESFATALTPPADLSVTGRPLVNLSLALDFASSGHAVASYHRTNLGLHLGCALLLFGLVRRTLNLAAISTGDTTSGRRSTLAAFVTALLWTLHPLQTAAVTYLMQRSELLVSFCYLLTLYAFAYRATSAPTSRGWLALAVLACAAGMAAKEVMVTAPLVVLLYDRMFVAGSFRTALRERAGFYSALAGTWLVLAALVLGTGNRGASAGFAAGIAWPDYAITQVYAVAHYLRLAVWPQPLVFDYGTPLIRDGFTLVVAGGVLLSLLVGVVMAFRRWPAVAFGGIVFFALLAPTSSVVPIATQTIAEHRLYLALAVPIAIFVTLLHRWLGRGLLIVALPLAVLLAVATEARNEDYRNELTLWRDTARKAPANARAHYNLGLALVSAKGLHDAANAFATALKLEPNHGLARLKLGEIQLAANELPAALPNLEAAVRLLPESPAAHFNYATALVKSGRVAEAAVAYAQVVKLNPGYGTAHYNLGNALAQLRRYPEALEHFEAALRIDPTDVSARRNAEQLRDYLRK